MSAQATVGKNAVNSDLKTLAPAFRDAVEKSLLECRKQGYDAIVHEAYRSNELQKEYFAVGRTVRVDESPITNAPTNLYSWHGYGLAVDVISRSKGWEVSKSWRAAVAAIFKSNGCAWGGDWKKPDEPHFQWGLCRPSPSDKARELLKSGDFEAVWQAVNAITVKKGAAPPNNRFATTRVGLNLRIKAERTAAVIRVLEPKQRLELLSPDGVWFQVRTDPQGETGYVHGDYILLDGFSEGAPEGFKSQDQKPLAAAQPIAVPSAPATRRRAIETWNRYGGLLAPKCVEMEIAREQAVAVLIVESGGAGFQKDRMIIRFENHKFYEYWGKGNRTVFDRHFRFDAAARWKGHMFSDGMGPFTLVHNDGQDSEWRVFEFACRLNETAALKSISMGAPQIMGFHHNTIGYPTARAMFDAFGSDVRHQINGLFDFLAATKTKQGKSLISLLQDRNYHDFAYHYNGSGQAAEYGKLIRSYVEAVSLA